jgi:predicted Rdx family selenoprotein
MGTDDTGRPAAIPAVIPSARFEDFEGFRETTLAVFTDPRANTALRTVGGLLYTISLEYARYWPREPDGAFRHQARAVLADLRHLEGWLGHLDQERTASALTAEEDRLSTLCGTFVPALKSIGDALEFEIGPAGGRPAGRRWWLPRAPPKRFGLPKHSLLLN